VRRIRVDVHNTNLVAIRSIVGRQTDVNEIEREREGERDGRIDGEEERYGEKMRH
jgi:hypothetical protein